MNTNDCFILISFCYLPLLLLLCLPPKEAMNGLLAYGWFPIVATIIVEYYFIKDCKRGFRNWEDSIFPQSFYKGFK